MHLANIGVFHFWSAKRLEILNILHVSQVFTKKSIRMNHGLKETKTCKTHKTLFVIESRNRSILHNLQSPATEENYGLKKREIKTLAPIKSAKSAAQEIMFR